MHTQRLRQEHMECVTWLKGLQLKCSLVMRLWLYAYLYLTIICHYVEIHVAGKLLLLLGLLVLLCFVLQTKRCIGNANMLVICVLIHTVQVIMFESRFGPWTKCQFGRMPSE